MKSKARFSGLQLAPNERIELHRPEDADGKGLASEPGASLPGRRPVQLLDPARPTVPMKMSPSARGDYEYVREGTANIFCIVEPLTGRRLTYASANAKAEPSAARARRSLAAAAARARSTW